MNEDFESIRNGALYALLAACSKEDLDPLVHLITGKLSNFLEINDDYIRFNPDHTKYHSVIGDEIRLFGGNSIKNMFRGFEGPPYSEIVADVCKKLDVPFEKGDVVKNESNLLDLFVKPRWNSLSDDERRKLANDARKEALEKVSSAASVAKAGAEFLFIRVLAGPAGYLSLGIPALDPAFRVTIPCVLHLAYLRRKILAEWQDTLAASSPKQLPGTANRDPEHRSAALALAGADNEPVLSLSRIPEPAAGAWRDVSSDDGLSQLNPLLQAVPSLIVAGEVATTNYMQVITNGDPLLRTKSGILKAITIGADGKFSGIAEVIEPSRLAGMVNVSALLSVASIALAQKHLADISKKLSEIKSAIADVRQFQTDERRSKMTGAIRYFDEIAPSILQGELPDHVLIQIEAHQSELLNVEEHLMADIRVALDKVRNFKDETWFGSAQAKQAIEEHQKQVNDLCRDLLLCIRARSCGWQLSCVFPGNGKSKARRRQSIQKSLEGLSLQGEVLAQTDSLFRNKIHELSSSWNTETTINARKLDLLKATDALLADVGACRNAVQNDLHAADEMVAAMTRPLAMAVRVEGGRISAVRPL